MKKTKILTLVSLAAVGGVLVSCASKEQIAVPFYFHNRASLRADLKEDIVEKGSKVYLSENGTTLSINDPFDPAVNVLERLEISAPVLSIYYSDESGKQFEDEATLSVVGYPKKAPIGTISWSSSDSSIATVDQSGKVTAKSAGLAVITATSSGGKSVSSKVYVNNSNVRLKEVRKSADKILERQKAPDFPTPKVVYVEMIYAQSKKRENEIISSSKYTQRMWASVDDAYFRLIADEEATLTNGGSIVVDNTAYVFYTTKDYTSYVISSSNGKSNYMTLDQSSLVDKEKTPFDGLGEVLQSFFVSGSKIMTGQYDDVLGQSYLSSSKYDNAKYRGSFGENSGQFAYRLLESQTAKLGADDAAELEIPVNTTVTINDDTSYLFADNLLSARNVREAISYEIGDVPYVDEIVVNYKYETEGVDLWWPDLSQFSKVDTIFDL